MIKTEYLGAVSAGAIEGECECYFRGPPIAWEPY